MLSRVLGVLMMGVPFAAALAALRPSAPTHGVRLEHRPTMPIRNWQVSKAIRSTFRS